MSRRVEGKVAIVTGVASGVGRSEVTLLAREGAKVVADISEPKESGVPEDSGRWPRSRVGAVDVFNTASVHRTVERLRVFSDSRPETFRQ